MAVLNLAVTILCLAASLIQAEPVKICVPEKLIDDCLQMQNDLPDKWQCVMGRDKVDCAKKLETGEADVANLDARALYISGKYFDGVPIATEHRNEKPYMYEAIALVLKDSDIMTPHQLQGRKACFTGLGRTAGWHLPIAQLLARRIMDPNCEEGDLAAVEEFFSGGSCAAWNWSSDPLVDAELKAQHPKLCSLCDDPESCSPEDKYSGYEGSVRCLVEGGGDVSFTKIPALKKLLEDDPSLADRVELLCLEGPRQPVTNLEDACHWGYRPSNAFVASAENYAENEDRFHEVIAETQAIYLTPRVQPPQWFHTVFLSSSKVTEVQKVQPDRAEYRSYLGQFIFVIEKPREGCATTEEPAKFCVTSDEERAKCEDLAKAAKARSHSMPVECVKSISKIGCMDTVKSGNAELVNLDGGDVYVAGRYHNLQPLSAELYDTSDASYYAVAVIRSQSDATKLSDLKGLRSCHTGMGRTAGWVVPVGALINHGDMDQSECNRALAVSEYFSEGSCVPGANDTKYNPDRAGADLLCKHCVGDENGENKCARDSKERYNGYSGSLRCLAEGRGDVAFVKHTTVPENTDGKGSQNLWSKDLLSSDFQLLCGVTGGTAAINNYLNCNLAKVPSHYVMTSGEADRPKKLQLQRLLAEASKDFSDKSDLFRAFDKYAEGQADLLFKDSTTALKAIGLHATYVEALGEEFLKASVASDPKAC